MRTVRIMLAAAVMLAVLGGSFAFSSSKGTLRCVYTKSTTGTTFLFTKTNILIPITTAATVPFATIVTTFDDNCPIQATVSYRWVISVEG